MKKQFKTKGEAEVIELKNQLIRALADYDNLRKRTDLEKEIWIKFASERILVALLPVLDSLEEALKHLQDQGLAMAVGEFKKIFSEEGLEEIQPKVGEEFNHEIHEVIEVEDDGQKDTIAEVTLNGWKFKEGKVIRFAKVKVFTGKKLTDK